MTRRCVRKIKALLVSMPWVDYQLPSLQVGCLAAYARRKGFDVEGIHLHLETAFLLGLKEYDNICFNYSNVNELFFAMSLFPEKKQFILKYLRRYISNPESIIKRILHVMKNIYNSIDWGKYDLIGFTVNYEQIFASLLFTKWIKRDFPSIKVVFGGGHTINRLGISLLECFSELDWCVDGEGEIAFTELLKCLSNGIKEVHDHVPGLVYRHRGEIHINPRQQLLKLDGLPDPDFEQYFHLLDKYSGISDNGIIPCLPIESSRGCTHYCTFCVTSVFWSGYRARPSHEVATQLERMSERYRISRFQFTDNTFPIKYRGKFFSIIEELNRDFRCFYEIRADADKDELVAMRRAGVCEVQIGIETLSTGLLHKMQKGMRAIDNLKVMKFCEELGIQHNSNLIIGFPTESQANVDETVRNIEYASAYRPPFWLATFGLYQGSPIYCQPDKYGIIKMRDAPVFSRLLPHPVAKNLSLLVKGFSSLGKPRDYRRLKRRFDHWKCEYEKALADNRILLSYYDCGSFLCIEDFRQRTQAMAQEREGVTVVTLQGEIRELYLFCDSYKNWDEIKKCFPKWDERDLKRTLNKLVKLKVMFREDDDYLSLAIRANGLRQN